MTNWKSYGTNMAVLVTNAPGPNASLAANEPAF